MVSVAAVAAVAGARILVRITGAVLKQGRPLVQDTVGAQGVEAKTRVFILYSRKDMELADKLEAALKVRGFEVLIDQAQRLMGGTFGG
jgi:hypothetical protein